MQAWRVQLQNGIFVLLNAYYDHEIQALRKVQEFDWQRADSRRLLNELHQHYDQLSGDDEVLAALGELNKTADPPLALGPREKYRENLAEMTTGCSRNNG